jgi:oligoribonuclease (3'-5' exoribonuclease)
MKNYKKMDRLLIEYTNKLIKDVGANPCTVEWACNIENDIIYAYQFYIPEVDESFAYALDVKTFNLITRRYEGHIQYDC